jgi:hypothetical protein
VMRSLSRRVGIFLPSEIEIASQRGTRAPKTLGSLYSLGEGD